MRHHRGTAVKLGDRTEIYGKCQFHLLALAQTEAGSADEDASGTEIHRLAQRTAPVRQNDVDDGAGAMACVQASFHDNFPKSPGTASHYACARCSANMQ